MHSISNTNFLSFIPLFSVRNAAEVFVEVEVVTRSALLLSGNRLEVSMLLLLPPASLQPFSLCLHSYEAQLLRTPSRVFI